jgi:hypothetical protein
MCNESSYIHIVDANVQIVSDFGKQDASSHIFIQNLHLLHKAAVSY